ncbi:hypothetical protein AMTRI_Chr11g97280 [Amborella trichopoda]
MTCVGSGFFFLFSFSIKIIPLPLFSPFSNSIFFLSTASSSFFIIFPLFLSFAPILSFSWLLRKTTRSPRARGRLLSELTTEERRRTPLFFLGLGTSLKFCPLIFLKVFGLVKFPDTSMAFLSSDPDSEIGFFLLSSGQSSWPFWLLFR